MNFFEKNRKKLLDKLNDNEAVLVHSGFGVKESADALYDFVVNKNFYYLTNIEQEDVYLYMGKTDGESFINLYIEKPDYDKEKWVGRKLTIDKAKDISSIDSVIYNASLFDKINSDIYYGKIEKLYFDIEKYRKDEFDTQALFLAKKYRDDYPMLKIGTFHKFITDMRIIKEDYEVETLQKAVDITQKGIERIMKNIEPGLKEYQMSAHFNFEIMTNGAMGNSFQTIMAGGENAVILHYVENSDDLKSGDLMLMDLGARYKYYSADISRTIPVNGKFTERQRQIYEIVLKANKEVIKIIKEGVMFSELNKLARKILSDGLLEIGLIKKEEEITKYYYHNCSHHLGMDTHDLAPGKDHELKSGMILTVEPGLYIAEEKIGIRIEDDILVCQDSNINLSKGIIKEVDEIEEFMKSK